MALKVTILLFLLAAFEFGFIDSSASVYTNVASTRGWYKYHSDEASFGDARLRCRSEGARLFHPDNAFELEQVLTALDVSNGIFSRYYLHMGLFDEEKNGEFKTVDGRPIHRIYNKWRSGQPEQNEYKPCAVLDVGSYELYVDYCTAKRPFICEVPPVESVVTSAMEDMKAIIANSSDTQSVMLQRLVEAAANQAAALDRIAGADTNQTIVMEQEVQALDKLARLLEESNEIDARSSQ